MLGVLLRQLRELGLERCDALLFRWRQIRARLTEIGERLLDKASPHWIEFHHFGAFTIGLEHFPQPAIERNRRVKISHFRQHLVERLALSRIVAHRVEMIQTTPAAAQFFGRVFKRVKCRFIGQRRWILIANRLDRLLGE
jgi:hypothetical protein